MFDIQLDLSKFIILWVIAFFIGFVGSILIFKIRGKVEVKNIVISLVVGCIFLALGVLGVFNDLVSYIP